MRISTVDHLFVSKLNLVEGGKNVTIAARFGGWENAGLEDVSMMSIVFIMGTKLGCCVVASKENLKTCLNLINLIKIAKKNNM